MTFVFIASKLGSFLIALGYRLKAIARLESKSLRIFIDLNI